MNTVSLFSDTLAAVRTASESAGTAVAERGTVSRIDRIVASANAFSAVENARAGVAHLREVNFTGPNRSLTTELIDAADETLEATAQNLDYSVRTFAVGTERDGIAGVQAAIERLERVTNSVTAARILTYGR